MDQVIKILTTQQSEIWNAIFQHIWISLVSLLIAAAIAIPLAIILMHRPKIAEVILQITSIMQTIPSLALLGILIPIVGIGTVPSIIALSIYAIMPIFQNTYSGLTGIDPSLEEAANAFGLSFWRKLTRIEIPLAMPTIISGLRIALVMIIGTATLAALIGAGGLGTYILLGIETNNNALLIIGAVLSAILALIFSGLIRWLSTLSLKRIGILLAGLAVLAVGAGSWQLINKPAPTITIAGKLGSEPEILINMYKDLIQDQDSKIQVKVKPNFGATSFLFKALEAKSIDIYPEFTGTVLDSIVKYDGATPHNPAKTYQLSKQLLQKQYQLDYLKPMQYQNGYDLAVTEQFAKRYDLKTISDLSRVESKIHAGFDPDFYQGKDGYPGLSKEYQLKFASVKTMEPALRYQSINKGKVNLVDGYTTDAEIQEYHLVVLKDNKNYFPPYQGAPLLAKGTLEKYPQIKSALEKLSGRISTSDMQKMNYLVNIKHEKAANVAHDYLVQHKLIKNKK